MDPLTLFGLVAVGFTLLCYILDPRSPWWTFGFAVGCLLSSIYGFLQGAWPFGIVELVWAATATWRWRQRAGAMSPPEPIP